MAKPTAETLRDNLYIIWIIAFLAVILFSIGNYFIEIEQYSRHVWADVWWTLASLIAGLKCYDVAGQLEHQLKKAWQYFGHACIAWFIGMLIWSYLELVEQVATPFPAWSDLGFLIFAPLFMMGIINFHAIVPSLPFRLLQISKLGIIFCCIVIVHIVILQESIKNSDQSQLYLIAAIAYPVLYMSLFVQTIMNAVFYVWGRLRNTTLVLSLSIIVFAISNTFYSLALLNFEYEVGNLLDVFWIAGFILVFIAACIQENTGKARQEDTGVAHYSSQFPDLEKLFPPAALLVTLIVLYLYRDNLDTAVNNYLFLTGLVLIIFVAFRELASKQVEDILIDNLKKSEATYRGILDNMHDTYYRADAMGSLVMVSPSVTELLGYKQNEIIGTKLADLYVEKDGREKFQNAIRISENGVRNYEAALYRKDGSVIWVSTNARFIKDEQGKIVGIEGTTRDVTERRDAEENLKKAHLELERRVLERTADLEKARIAAEKASEAKSEFLSRMSHELRTPLNAILGFAQLLEADPSIEDEDHQGNIKEILSSGYHLLELISDILDLSQIESGSMHLTREEVTIDTVIKQCLSMVKPIADANGVRLVEINPQGPLPNVLCDVTRLRQAIINLLSNAVKYNRQNGSVTVSCERSDNDMVRINIIDTGPGIPREKLDKLFVPFERLGAERTTVEGTGIGLTISRRLIEMMDGKLVLKSTNSDGSHFFIELPIVH